MLKNASPKAAASACASILVSLALSGCAPPTQVTPVSVAIMIRNPAKAAPAPSSAPAGCFAAQMDSTPWEADAAAATVRIVAATAFSYDQSDITSLHESFSGSGVIVGDSADASNPHNRILTAAHVIDATVAAGGRIGIVTSSGKLVGSAHVVARSSATGTEASAGSPIPKGDQVVLAIDRFFSGGVAAYDRIRGVELAPRQSRHILTGIFATPGGIDGGASGGPVFDAETGKVSALMVRAERPKASMFDSVPWIAKVQVEGGYASWDYLADKPLVRPESVNLPQRGAGFAEPVSDPVILSALGMGGSRVGTDNGPVRHVKVFGYPLGICVLYSGKMGSSSIF